MGPEVGSRAQPFQLAEATGRERELGELISARGVAFVFVGPLSDPRGVAQLRAFRDALGEFNALLLNLAIVAELPSARGRKALATLDVRFPLLCDERRELASAWGLAEGGATQPAAIVVDLEGQVTHATVGAGAQRPSAEAVLEALRAGRPDSPTAPCSARFADRMAAWKLRR